MRTDWEHLRMVSASAISPVLAYYTPDEGILAGIGVGLCLQHLCGYEGGRGEFHVLRELFFRQVQERPGRTGPLRGDNLLPLYGYDCEYDEDDICNLLSIYVYNATPVLNGTTVFVPIVATITITTPNACKCQAETQVINERFVVAFQGRTTLPTSVTINQLGMTQGLIKIVCGKSNCYAINSSLSVSIPAEPAA